MLIDGFLILTQEQVNMLFLGAEPMFEPAGPPDWKQPYWCPGYPILVAPEHPETLELGEGKNCWVIFAIKGVAYAFQPAVVKATVDRLLIESVGLRLFSHASNTHYNVGAVGLFQQRPWTLPLSVKEPDARIRRNPLVSRPQDH